MNKRSILAGAALLVLATTAWAGEPVDTVCVDFAFPFCDALELTFHEDDSISGRWANWDCVGGSLEVFGGKLSNARARVFCAGAQCPNGISWMFNIVLPERELDLFGWDMVDPPFFQALGHPFRAIPGACPFHPEVGAGSEPSWAENSPL